MAPIGEGIRVFDVWRVLPRPVRHAARPLVRYWMRSGHRVQLSRSLASLIRSLRGIVLDVGGGRAALHDSLWQEDARRLRVDISYDRQPDVTADAALLPFRSGSVDGVVMCELLEHVARPGRAWLRFTGYFVREESSAGPCPSSWGSMAIRTDFFRYTEAGLGQLLAPFSQVLVRPHGNHIGAAWRLFALRFPVAMIANPALRSTSDRTDGVAQRDTRSAP